MMKTRLLCQPACSTAGGIPQCAPRLPGDPPSPTGQATPPSTQLSTLALVGALTVGLSTGLFADRAQAETYRSHAAHEHGSGQLDIAIDGGQLEAVLRLPAMDLLGFEQAAENAEQRASVERALTLLRDGEQLLRLPAAADCTLSAAEARFTGDEHHDDEHDDEHAGDGQSHSELHAHWHFSCGEMAELNAFELGLFEHASSEQILVQLIGPNGQTAATLTPGDKRFQLTP